MARGISVARRRFLKLTTAAVAGPALLRSGAVLAADPGSARRPRSGLVQAVWAPAGRHNPGSVLPG